MKNIVDKILRKTNPTYRIVRVMEGRLLERLHHLELEVDKMKRLQEEIKIHLCMMSPVSRARFSDLEPTRSDLLRRYYLVLPYVKEHAEILDIPCGKGFGSFLLATRSACKQIHAVADSYPDLKFAQEAHASSKITFLYADHEEIDILKDHYDIAVMLAVGNNIWTSQRSLLKIAASLRSDGSLFLAFFDKEQFRKDIMSNNDLGFFEFEDIERILKSCGLVIREFFAQTTEAEEIVKGKRGWITIVKCNKQV